MRISLENERLLVVLSTEGGALERVFNKETREEHIWKYDRNVWARRTSVCFPICGKVLDDEYVFQDEMYSLPMHGFVREKDFSVLSRTERKVVLRLRSDDETIRIYPFTFTLTLTTELAGDHLGIVYDVENTGEETMYYSIGSHYTYKVPTSPGGHAACCCIDFLNVQEAGRLVFSEGFLEGKTEDLFKGRQTLTIQELCAQGSVAFELSDLTSSRVMLRCERSSFRTAVSMENFSHLVLWAPAPGSPFICIEAWAGISDPLHHSKRFREKPGILSLVPHGLRRHEQLLEFH